MTTVVHIETVGELAKYLGFEKIVIDPETDTYLLIDSNNIAKDIGKQSTAYNYLRELFNYRYRDSDIEFNIDWGYFKKYIEVGDGDNVALVFTEPGAYNFVQRVNEDGSVSVYYLDTKTLKMVQLKDICVYEHDIRHTIPTYNYVMKSLKERSHKYIEFAFPIESVLKNIRDNVSCVDKNPSDRFPVGHDLLFDVIYHEGTYNKWNSVKLVLHNLGMFNPNIMDYDLFARDHSLFRFVNSRSAIDKYMHLPTIITVDSTKHNVSKALENINLIFNRNGYKGYFCVIIVDNHKDQICQSKLRFENEDTTLTIPMALNYPVLFEDDKINKIMTDF